MTSEDRRGQEMVSSAIMPPRPSAPPATPPIARTVDAEEMLALKNETIDGLRDLVTTKDKFLDFYRKQFEVAHKLRSVPDPFAEKEQYLVGCYACDHNHVRSWRPGDPPYLCKAREAYQQFLRGLDESK